MVLFGRIEFTGGQDDFYLVLRGLILHRVAEFSEKRVCHGEKRHANSPLATCMTASVPMNGGTRNTVAISPENRPVSAHAPMPAAPAKMIVPAEASAPPRSRIRLVM